MIATQPVKDGREGGVAHESILVFELVAEGGVGPGALNVVSLIIESSAIEVVNRLERTIEENKVCEIAAAVGNGVFVLSPVVVFKGYDALLPARGTAQG